MQKEFARRQPEAAGNRMNDSVVRTSSLGRCIDEPGSSSRRDERKIAQEKRSALLGKRTQKEN
jgi:hypothetical protein